MKKGVVLGIVVLFIGISIIPSTATNIRVNKSSFMSLGGNTLYVGGSGPDNYTTIQSAINDASEGDTVFVYDDSSPYYENLFIKKRITLMGEDKNTTVIRGNDGATIDIREDYVTVTGFTIKSLNIGGDGIILRIMLYGYCNVYNNIITNNRDGIAIEGSPNHKLFKNIIINNRWGIRFYGYPEGYSHYNNIYQNLIMNNIIGIYVNSGMWERYVRYNKIYENNIINNYWGIENSIGPGWYNEFYHNNFIKNKIHALEGGRNTWDNGTEGNYWDDYTGEDNDGDGIGDTPYDIPRWNDKDYFPLMEPYYKVTNFNIEDRIDMYYSSPLSLQLLYMSRENLE